MALLRVLVLTALAASVLGLGCLDDNGNPIDWSILMKIPKVSGTGNPTVTAGLAYTYMDINTPYALSAKSMQQNEDAAANTLGQLYSQASGGDVGWLIYDDEGASGPSCGYCGHTKGVVGFDANGAFWLIHSVPKYPPAVSGGGTYSYPASGTDYGQSFLCTSLPFEAIENVAYQLLYTAPDVYDSNLPDSLASQLPGVKAVINKDHITVANTSVMAFTTVGGNDFVHLAKTAQWGEDLYESFVAPYWNVDLYIETWMRPKMASFCPPTYDYAVMDITKVTLWDGIAFTETKDHSKWAISASSDDSVVCIGDINHQPSQFARAGGTMCFANSSVYSVFQSFVTTADTC